MGVCNCEKHGRTGLRIICAHLRENMLLGVKPSRFFNVAYSLGNLASKPEYPLTAGSTYCLLCAETYGLPREDTVQSEVEFEIAPDEILQTVCGRCFAGFLAESATA